MSREEAGTQLGEGSPCAELQHAELESSKHNLGLDQVHVERAFLLLCILWQCGARLAVICGGGSVIEAVFKFESGLALPTKWKQGEASA